MSKSSPSVAAGTVETIKTVAAALAIAFVLRGLLFQPFTIPSESMQPGLLVGDYVVVTKFDYGWSRYSVPMRPPLGGSRLFGRPARRGEVVVFKKLDGRRQVDVIKRVIGLPGDRVQVVGGALLVNGQPVPRTGRGKTTDPGAVGRPVWRFEESLGGHGYTTFDRGQSEGDYTKVYLVPGNSYFVMGDNRDNSADSRWPEGVGMGFVPAENLVGRARFVLASWRPSASILKPWTWLNLREDRFFRGLG